jgi:hypothetical protein
MNEKLTDPEYPAKKTRTYNWITFVMAVSPLIYYIIALYLNRPPGEMIQSKMAMKQMFIFISVTCVFLGLFFNRKALEKFPNRSAGGNSGQSGHPVITRFLCAAAFHESISIYGLVWYLVSGQMDFLNVAVPVSIALILFDRTQNKIEPLEID